MIDPRKSFKESAAGKIWQDIADGGTFEYAALTAMAQMQINLPGAPDMGSAAANHFRMEGAKIFLQTLMSLTEPVTERAKPTGINLNHIP